jgi:dienelactone hydrolase
MFDLIAGTRKTEHRKALMPVLVSASFHAVVMSLFVLVPLLYLTERLPEVPTMMAFVAAPPAPPPPPPPPEPTATRPAAPVKPQPTAGFVAPVEAPLEIQPEQPAGPVDEGFDGEFFACPRDYSRRSARHRSPALPAPIAISQYAEMHARHWHCTHEGVSHLGRAMNQGVQLQKVEIPHAGTMVDAYLCLPVSPRGIFIFTHGGCSSRFSYRNLAIAGYLIKRGFAALLPDVTREEKVIDVLLNPDRVARRFVSAIDWACTHPGVAHLPICCFGSSVGAAVAVTAAAMRSERVRTVVALGGWLDLADAALGQLITPTLLIVGAKDRTVLEVSHAAMPRMRAPVNLAVIPGATRLFQEPGALDAVCRLTETWCRRHLVIPYLADPSSEDAHEEMAVRHVALR